MTSAASNEPAFLEKSIILLRDGNGFGLRLKGQAPVLVEHVHERGAAWRAGIRAGDKLSRVNGIKVDQASHKDVVLMFKSCARFVGLTIQLDQHAVDTSDASKILALAGMVKLPVASPEQQNQIPLAKQLVLSRLNHATGSNGSHSHHSFSAADSLLLRPTAASQLKKPPSAGHSPLNKATSPEGSPNLATGVQTPSSEASAPASILVRPLQTRRSESVTHRPNSKLVFGDGSVSVTPPTGKMRLATTELIRQRILGGRIRDPNKQQSIGFMMSKRSAGGQKLGNEELAKSGELRQTVGSQDARYLRLKHSASSNSLRPQSRKPEGADIDTDHRSVPIIVVPATKPRAPTNKRLEIIREFIDTEKTHTDRLKCLDELFYKPLKAGGLMSDEQLRSVFSCHKTLYNVHRQIYRILLSATHNLYLEPMIGSALIEIFEGDLRRKLERAACSFCSAQSTNADLLNKLTRRDTNVGEFIAQVAQQQTADRLGIKDLLASCFQRLTKYPLLLDNLLKATPKTLAEFVSQSGSRLNPSLGRSSGGGHSRRKLMHDRSTKRRSNDDDDEDEDEEMNDENRTDDLDDDQESNDSELEEQVRQSQRMLAISLAEEREFIERALDQSRRILFKVDDYVKVAISHNKLNEIWRKTEKYPGVSSVDISKQHVIHDGSLTLRLSRRSFDVYVLLLNDYIVILTREGQDKYKLKSFNPEGKSSASSAAAALVANSGDRQALQQQSVYSPIFLIDEHLATRDAATDENGFYLLCKRKDDSRIYEFASRSPAERLVWRDKIQWAVERQMSRSQRRSSCESTITKSSSELSTKQDNEGPQVGKNPLTNSNSAPATNSPDPRSTGQGDGRKASAELDDKPPLEASGEPDDRIAGTISYVEDDGLVMPSKMGCSRPFVDQAVQVNLARQDCI